MQRTGSCVQIHLYLFCSDKDENEAWIKCNLGEEDWENREASLTTK